MLGPEYDDVGIDTVSLLRSTWLIIAAQLLYVNCTAALLDPRYTDIRFNNYTLVNGYNSGLEWYCNQTDYFRTSDQRHWTIIGEFTRMCASGLLVLNDSLPHGLRAVVEWAGKRREMGQ